MLVSRTFQDPPELGPLQDGVQRRTQCLTPRRETVLHLGRYLGIDFTHDDAIGFHAAKLLAEHLLRNIGNGSLQVRKAQHLATEEMKQDDELPASFEKTEGRFHVMG